MSKYLARTPGIGGFGVARQLGEVIEDPGSLHLSAYRPQCSRDAT